MIQLSEFWTSWTSLTETDKDQSQDESRFVLGSDEGVLIYGFDHVLKLDLGGPGPAVIDDGLPGALPAVHWRSQKHHTLEPSAATQKKKRSGHWRSTQRHPRRRQRTYASVDDSLRSWSPVRYLQDKNTTTSQLVNTFYVSFNKFGRCFHFFSCFQFYWFLNYYFSFFWLL